MTFRLTAGLLIVVLATAVSMGQTPLGTEFTYQGRLRSGGSPANGLHDLRFRLYDASAAGAQVGATLCANNVSVTDGLFTVWLDFGAQFAGQQRFLEIEVRTDTGLDCANATGFIILAPRQALTAAPNALYSLNADKLDGLNSSAFLQSIPVPLTLAGTSNNWMIKAENATTAAGAAAIHGAATGASSNTHGGYFTCASTSGTGVLGLTNAASGTTYGVRGQSSSTDSSGVYGAAIAATGETNGVWGRSTSTSGRGVFGQATATSGITYGVYAESNSTNGRGVYGVATAAGGVNYGVHGRSDSTVGTGVFGEASATTGFTSGGRFTSASPDGRGVSGIATATSGDNQGVFGQSASTIGQGVFGWATAASGATHGVHGESQSPSGRGVYGETTAATGSSHGVHGRSASTTGRGVYGEAVATSGTNYGVYGESDSPSGRGVYGAATFGGGTNYGVYGWTEGNSGRGVHGIAVSDTGTTYGGYFQSNSTTGRGVYGNVTADSGTTYGVWGVSNSPSGRGLFGEVHAASGTPYGVYGAVTTFGNGYGVYAQGDFGASGSKSFRIDHPDDPANKYLLHYAAESPEVINFYSETVTLDAHGEAVVELPHYFAKINTRPRYQLTAVGSPMPTLHVAEKISESALSVGATAQPAEAAPICSFRIAGGVPCGEVSWEVKAVRNDRWVQKRGAPVEVEKQDLERGTYQHPELYGQPPEKGMNYDAAGSP